MKIESVKSYLESANAKDQKGHGSSAGWHWKTKQNMGVDVHAVKTTHGTYSVHEVAGQNRHAATHSLPKEVDPEGHSSMVIGTHYPSTEAAKAACVTHYEGIKHHTMKELSGE